MKVANLSLPEPRFLGLSAAAAAGLAIAVATLFRLWYCTWLPLLPDEAYYFQWSRHLDASYFSKGPAVAYTIWAGTKLFGDNAFGIRFFAVMLSAGTAWQVFLLARRWYDATAGLVAVLLAGVVPLYAVGAVLMTIDPLSAFFWVWAANLFSSALERDRPGAWLLCGFAVGSGFLGKYLNALELLAFFLFLLLAPERRRLLRRPGFWLLLATAVACMLPVFWWNALHHWASAAQLGNRGRLEEPHWFRPGTFLEFLGEQAGVVSPLLFLALLAGAAVTAAALLRARRISRANEGELLFLLLFLSVFLFYAVLAFHMRCEPNWPAVSYLSLLVLLAGRWRQVIAWVPARIGLAAAFLLAWLQTVLLHDTAALPLPARRDPMERAQGWSELAARTDQLRRAAGATAVIADGYQQASILAFDMPGKPFVYALRREPPANQYDFWPWLDMTAPQRVLWVSADKEPGQLRGVFPTIIPLGRMQFYYRGVPVRAFSFYLCESGVNP